MLGELLLSLILLSTCSFFNCFLWVSTNTSPRFKAMTMPGQSIFSGRLTSMPPVQLAAWLAHVRRASQLCRESRLPFAAMAMILTPPGLRNIPCRNFPFGTLVALAVCAPWWGQLSPHLPFQTPAKKGSFHTAFPRVHWKPSCGKLWPVRRRIHTFTQSTFLYPFSKRPRDFTNQTWHHSIWEN